MKIIIDDLYQTIPSPDGDVIQGLFPTIEWFEEIKKHVSFEDKSVLDVGCNVFSYGLQAILAGAMHVTGVDCALNCVQQSRIFIDAFNFTNAKVVQCEIEKYQPVQMYDVVIFSMILHHLKESQDHLKRLSAIAKEKVVVIYRHLSEEESEPGWTPTFDELDDVISRIPLVHKFLLQTKEQYIGLGVYDKYV